jgi:tRNA A-37 threonylcarbamoyl transferase component Bud32
MPEVLRRVGRYDLLEVIGRGGAAVVYLAHQRDLHRHVALKELAPFHADDSSFAQRFVEESRLAGSLSHANVVTVHEFFEDAGVPYIAMEYLPHGSLRQYVGELSTAQIAGVLEGVLAGLSHGEAHGIAHRDLKPENLLVAADGRVKIADFGVARAYNKAATRAVVTAAGTTIGTPAYMAPEQALGGELTAATDLYSLGIIAWELLSGTVPFEEDDTPVAVLYRHVHEPAPPVRSVAPEVDPLLEEWVQHMLAKRPEDRFRSADEAWEALEDAVLELLGPRWRRQARLVVQGNHRRAGETLTPAAFEAASGEPPAAAEKQPEQPVAKETLTDVEPASEPEPVRAAVPLAATVQPKHQPRAIHTTLFRIARRHQDADAGDRPSGSETRRRRTIAVAIAVGMAVAAAAGWAVAGTGSEPAKKHPNPNAAAQRQVTAVVNNLAATRRTELERLNNVGNTSTQQARYATALQSTYNAAANQLAPFERESTEARALRSTLAHTAIAYGSLAAAAKAYDSVAFRAAEAAARSGENQLHNEVKAL